MIQNCLKSMEVLFLVEYIITLLIINGVFNCLYIVLWCLYMYCWIGNPLLRIYPTSTLWCISFALFTPFSLSAFPTDVPHPWKGLISFHLCFSLPHFFYSPLFFVHSPYPFWPTLHIKHDIPSIKTHTTSLLFLPVTYLFVPPQKSELLESRTPKPTTEGFGA